MKKRHSIGQIMRVLSEVEGGEQISAVARRHNITKQTYYRWRHKYGGMNIAEARRLKELEEENTQLKKKVADLVLENDLLKEINSKNF